MENAQKTGLSANRIKMSTKQRWNYALIIMGRVLLLGFGMHLEKYYTDKIGFSATLFGTAHLLSAVLNSISDPAMGAFINNAPDDRRHSKYKRFMAWAIPVMLVGMVFSLFVLPDWPTWLVFTLLVLGFVAAHVGFAMHNVSHGSLVLEETAGATDRARYSGLDRIVTVIGGVIVYLAPFRLLVDNRVSQRAAGTILVFLTLLGAALTGLFVAILRPKARRHQVTGRKKAFASLLQTLRFRQFALYIGVAFFAGMVPNMAPTFNAYYLDNVLEADPKTITLLAGVVLVPQFLVLGFAGALVKRIGIHRLFFFTTIVQIVVYVGILLGLGGAVGMVLYVLMNMFVLTWWVISFGLLGQITDNYKWRYGQVDDAVFLSIQAVLVTPAVSLAKFVFFAIIEAFGYDGTLVSQTARGLRGLQVGMGSVGVGSLLLALVLMLFYVRSEKSQTSGMATRPTL